MSDLQIMLLSIIGGAILIVILLTSILYSQIKAKNKDKHIEQITREPYFVNEKHTKEKWWVSKDGLLEKNWMKGQDYDFKVSIFNYYENFSEGFFNSKFVRTKSFLLQIMDVKSVNRTIERLKIHAGCLENIWWRKYKILMNSSFNDMPKVTKAPEYFFYKYYFEFIYQLRKIMSDYLTNHIIPNTIFLELKPIYYKQYGIKKVDDPQKNIVFAFNQVSQDANALSDRLHSEFTLELAAKGAQWTVDYKSTNDLLIMLQPDHYIQKLFLKDKIWKLTKKYKLPATGDLDEAIQNLENHIKSIEENNVNQVREYIDRYQEIKQNS
ncbi:hypothetical protein [Spiroplasma culicicola]|uniref:Uncharacterized protein n=1 Tax=Spiroplasma culicicola AES-1 TaxID=1276246 RepID=W6AGD6_9MOLU|nr:hypothetical protein [Spiroplasma culicicola]AHI52724.1 hypothetical protein SCULI_v1c03830 [Spiroplasma culicicola AES-1]